VGLASNPTCSPVLAILSSLVISEIGPNVVEPTLTTQDPVPDYFLALLEVPDYSLLTPAASLDNLASLAGSPTCSLDIFPSLANVIGSPSCSVDISTACPDNSYCLPENSVVPTGKLGPYVEKGFEDLDNLALALSELYSIGEAYNKSYVTYGLKGSNEEVVFYEECIEPTLSLVKSTPSLAEGLLSLVLDTPSPSSILGMSMDKGESTGSLSRHGPPVGVSPGPYMTPVLPISTGLCFYGHYQKLYDP